MLRAIAGLAGRVGYQPNNRLVPRANGGHPALQPDDDRLLHEGRLPEAGCLRSFASGTSPRPAIPAAKRRPQRPEASNVVTVNTVLAGNKQLASPVGTNGRRSPSRGAGRVGSLRNHRASRSRRQWFGLSRGRSPPGRTVALKFINEIGAQEDSVMREARAQARIDHPGSARSTKLVSTQVSCTSPWSICLGSRCRTPSTR